MSQESITVITSNTHLDEILEGAEDKVTVIDFHAAWCGPCHMIAPTYKELSEKHTDVRFLKCDVDEVEAVAGRFGISAMPTFIILKGNNQIDMVRGANKELLKATIAKHAPIEA